MANGRIKINELPETALVKDNDIFIIENDTTTQKISLGSLINYIKEHEEIAEYFVKQSAVDSENGVAPLDSNRKIPSANLPFGSTENTIYDGALGQALSDALSSHLADTNNPHALTKAQIGLSDVDNTNDASKPVSALQREAIDAAHADSNAYTDAKIAELVDVDSSTLNTLTEIAQALQNGDVSGTFDSVIGNKADKTDLNAHTEDSNIHITASEREQWNDKVGNNDDASNTTISFSESSDLSNISTGEKTGSIMGKISKSISTLISHISAKATANSFGHVKLSDTYQNALTDGDAANGLGASQKALADAYSALNSDLGNCTFSVQSDGAYVTYTPEGGADTVTKKLGSGSKTVVGTFSGTVPSRPAWSSGMSQSATNYTSSKITGDFPSIDKSDYIIEITGAYVSISNKSYTGGSNTAYSAYPHITSISQTEITIGSTGALVTCRTDTAHNTAYVIYSGIVYYIG
ncbi:MAG: hypothetical protein HDQ99_19395 [Lachnospiraceae bacterium]|nr:hypothetical protein [Lachnospiraceae bacterium]